MNSGSGSGRVRRSVAVRSVAVRSVVVLGALVVLTTAGCSSGAASTPTTPAARAHAAATGTIAISNFMFIPAHLTVAPGASVTVVNRDDVTHTLTSTSGRFDTKGVAPGASVTITAPSTPGTYPYICSIHQYMSGTLTVA